MSKANAETLEAIDYEQAKYAAQQIMDYADVNLSMMEAADMDTKWARQIYLAAKELVVAFAVADPTPEPKP